MWVVSSLGLELLLLLLSIWRLWLLWELLRLRLGLLLRRLPIYRRTGVLLRRLLPIQHRRPLGLHLDGRIVGTAALGRLVGLVVQPKGVTVFDEGGDEEDPFEERRKSSAIHDHIPNYKV